MIAFLTDTLLWTGGLIAAVLVLRRPVARWLGAGSAYALWALPALRLLLPPITLPHWLAPAARDPQPFLSVSIEMGGPLGAVDSADPAMASVVATPAIDWSTVALVVWLAGTALFLARRYALYFRMRSIFLAEARPMGNEGRIRFVETPAADGPVAFGVRDKVIALPQGFMASREVEARDLALAHELAHHRGHDLLLNMLVQPLFAIHWFNPLCWLGWQALRRDQEAACDARVVGTAPRERRAAYAAVIAKFAARHPAGANLALAAPMVCPVLGGRSILHRLRSITMPDISPRRRWAGRALIGSAVLALPLTASISYAQDAVSAPTLPAPPAPPVGVAPPAHPTPPAPPAAVDGDHPVRIIRIERRTDKDGKPLAETDAKDGDVHVYKRVIMTPHGEANMSAEDRAEFEKDMAEIRKEFGEGGEFRKEMREQFGKDGKMQRQIRIAMADAGAAGARVMVNCRDGQRDAATMAAGADGRPTVFVCTSAATGQARAAIARAKAAIASNRDLSNDTRAEVMRSLEEAEKGLREE